MIKLRPADSLTVFFCIFLVLLTAGFYRRIPHAGYLILIYGSLIAFQIVLARIGTLNSFLAVTHDIIFPVLGVVIIFDTLGLIVHKVNPQDLDYLLIRLDYLIFGAYPTVVLEKIAHPLLTDVLQLAYTTYYFQAVTVGIAVRLKGNPDAYDKTLFLILLCFYLSFLGYILLPALGPRYAMEHLHERELEGFLLSEPVQRVLNLLEGVKRDAFPSGHTAIALTVLYLSYRYVRGLFRVLLIPVVLLVVSTVYCRYHYVVDVMGGILLAVVTILVGEVYYKFAMRRYGHPPDSR